MAPKIDARRAVRPPLESVRQAPFALVRDADGGYGDGMTLDGYGSVFNRITVINSYEGRFRERFALNSMKKSFRENPPIVQFDHGRNARYGSLPIAEIRSITEDVDPVLAPEGGAHIVARMFSDPFFGAIREVIKAGAVSGMSHRFSVVRESWETADGKPIKDDRALMALLEQCYYDDVPDDQLPLRTIREARVAEMGPVVWPAYTQTSVSIRSKVIDLGRLADGDPEQIELLGLATMIAAHTRDDDAPQATEESAGEHPSESDDDAPQATGTEPAGEHPSNDDAPRSTDSPSAGEHPSNEAAFRRRQPRRLSDKNLRVMNQRDRLLTLRTIGERSQ